ncbi:MAG TPA: CHRD domain-containing protein [Edaphobacter sp.]|nr:CHRD domain-containing protein [Edaphobacter sp.]
MKFLLPLLAAALLTTQAAFASTIVYTANLNGATEEPPTGSPGTGFATVMIDDIANTMAVNVTFSGLTAGNTAAHIHCCTATPGFGNAGVATITPTFTGFPSGVTSGIYDHVFDLTAASSYNPAFVTAQGSLAAAEAALLAGLASDETYLNIHTSTNPGGEIRGFLVAVPEPASLPLAVLTLGGLAFFWRAKRLRSRA